MSTPTSFSTTDLLPHHNPHSPQSPQSNDIKIDIIQPTKISIVPSGQTTQSQPDSVVINLDQLKLETCEICFADCSIQDLRTPLPCEHAFCSGCMSQYLATKIQSNEVLHIPCPQAGCTEIFTDKAVESVLTAEEHKRFQDLVLKKISMKDAKEKFCPQPGCSRELNLETTEDFLTCECGAKVCKSCNNLYHEGKTCIEALDVEFEVYAKENQVRFCMMCKTIIVKEEGCNTIKCAVCDYKWCWLCGNEYEPKHECNGEWSPLPPASVRLADWKGRMKKGWQEASIIKRIGIVLGLVLASPLILIALLILAPTLYMMKDKGKLVHERPVKSFCSGVGVVILGIVYLPQTVSLLICLTVYTVIVKPILYLVRTLKRKLKGEAEVKVEDKIRWQSRNLEKFVYRPTDPHS